MFVFGVIPARAGSKGLPGKNLKRLAGRPLIAWSVASARKSRLLDRFIVSTEDKAIAAAARRAGGEAPFKRPSELARDDSSIIDVLQHAVRWLESAEKITPDVVILLQATSPFRSGRDIDETVKLVLDGADSAQTVAEDKAHPWHRFLLEDGRLKQLYRKAKSLSRRQDAPPLYRPTGSVYAVRRALLMREGTLYGKDHRGLVRPFESSVDIDDIWDFRLAEAILREKDPAR